jgi:ABC transporter substrate binding protein
MGLLAAPLAAETQPAKVYRIGALANALPSAPESVRYWEAFAEGLRERGYIVGENVVIERRSTEEQIERFPSLAAELVARKVDLIVAVGTQAVYAAKQATSAIPIVMVYVLSPVEAGLVESLAGNGSYKECTQGPGRGLVPFGTRWCPEGPEAVHTRTGPAWR